MLADVARDLYGVPPAEFVAARNARAARAKAEGDAGLAAQIKALRKPVIGGWVVNMLVRQSPERIAELDTLGEQLQRAQDELDSVALRELTMRRRTLTAAIARDGATVAGELGHPVSAAVVDQVRDTLHAVMSDRRVADAVRTGLLLTPLTASGLDDVDVAAALAVPDASTAPSEPDRSAPIDLSAHRTSARARAAKEMTEAKAALRDAEAAATKTERAARAQRDRVQQVQAKVLQLRAELDELARQLNEVEERLEPATTDLQRAQQAAADADALDLAAQAAIKAATTRLTRARGRGSR